MMPSGKDYGRTRIAKEALASVRELSAVSKLTRREVPRLRSDQVEDDRRMIGQGAYSYVHRVRVTRSHELAFSSTKSEERYALKCLKPERFLDDDKFKIAVTDLAMEADLLSRLNHPNVIRLVAVAACGKSSDFNSDHDALARCFANEATIATGRINDERGYFILLDLLDDTLAKRLNIWRTQQIRSAGNKKLAFDVFSKHKTLRARIDSISIQLAKGMEYLHQNNIILRDLKPDNVGFDKRGTVKIFDFGFAREIHTCKTVELAGSYRYMAPECMAASSSSRRAASARSKEVSLKSDVYSFGMLLWELCTLHKPFKHCTTTQEMTEAVVYLKQRPSVRSIPSLSLQRLISQCWDHQPSARPDFHQIREELELRTFPKIIGKKIRIALEKRAQSLLGSSNSLPSLAGFSESAKLFQDRGGLRRSQSAESTVQTHLNSEDTIPSIADELESVSPASCVERKRSVRRTRGMFSLSKSFSFHRDDTSLNTY